MRLVKCEDVRSQVVTCFRCNRPVSLRLAHADLDGPAFKAYYCPGCAQELEAEQLQRSIQASRAEIERQVRVDIRRDDSEPVFQHQVERDSMTKRKSYLCTDPNCDIKMPGHSHYARRGK